MGYLRARDGLSSRARLAEEPALITCSHYYLHSDRTAWAGRCPSGAAPTRCDTARRAADRARTCHAEGSRTSLAMASTGRHNLAGDAQHGPVSPAALDCSSGRVRRSVDRRYSGACRWMDLPGSDRCPHDLA